MPETPAGEVLPFGVVRGPKKPTQPEVPPLPPAEPEATEELTDTAPDQETP